MAKIVEARFAGTALRVFFFPYLRKELCTAKRDRTPLRQGARRTRPMVCCAGRRRGPDPVLHQVQEQREVGYVFAGSQLSLMEEVPSAKRRVHKVRPTDVPRRDSGKGLEGLYHSPLSRKDQDA